jgi:zinc protease|tara:strand:- start:1477 stop:2739 length:1263 start_codon:yes stop_codon:yes gene_type:complete
MRTLPGSENITSQTLPNGIIVIARENPQSPSVVVDAFIHAGSIYEKRSKAGLANFAASMLMRGTKTASFEEIYENIESVGTSLGVSSAVHTVGFGGKSLPEDLGLLLETAADAVRNPIFPHEHLERMRAEILTGLAMRAHNTRAMASLAFYETLFGSNHPYGYSNNGYQESIESITRANLQEFHKEHYGPTGMIITIVGNVTARKAIALVESHFGDWKNDNQPNIAPAPTAQMINHTEKQHVHIPGKTQTDIVLGYVGPRRSDPDFQSVRIANSILGVFGMYGRLGKTVRKKHGLAYYSFSRADASFGPGTWRLIAGVDPTNVDTAINLMLEEIGSLITKLVDHKELADNKSYILGSIPIQLETNEGIAAALASMELHGLGMDYLQHLPKQIKEISRQDIRSAAARLLDPDTYVVTSAGS